MFNSPSALENPLLVVQGNLELQVVLGDPEINRPLLKIYI